MNKQTATEVKKSKRDVFEETVLPHLNSAYNLARWMTRNEHDADDIVQESFLRAFRSFDTFLPDHDPRAWLLAIVRNASRTWLKRNRSQEMTVPFDDSCEVAMGTWSDPEAELIRNANSQQVHEALKELPFEYREILALRELEELPYKDIAEIVQIPLGTVMSRLSRARRELYSRLTGTVGIMPAGKRQQ